MGQLDGKVGIVTGAASGIGKAIAERFVAEGARVFLVDRDEAGLAALIGQLGHNQTDGQVMDVRDEPAVERAVAACLRRFGRLDIVVNNAGMGSLALITDLPLAQFERVMSVNVAGVFLGIKHGGRALIKAGHGGAIINTSSINGLVPARGMGAYATSKAAVIMLTQVAAMELGPHRIRVNAIAPGYVPTNMSRAISANDALAQDFRDAAWLGREVDPAELAGLVTYLASDAAGGITGQTIPLDAGIGLGRFPDMLAAMEGR